MEFRWALELGHCEKYPYRVPYRANLRSHVIRFKSPIAVPFEVKIAQCLIRKKAICYLQILNRSEE